MKIFRFHNLQPTSRMMLPVLALIPVLPALGADAPTESIFVAPADIKWQDPPPTLPKGAKVAVLYGDPGKAGPFVIRLRAPAGYRIPPHWHSQTENLTVISGNFHFGSGDKQDTAREHTMKAGSYHYVPAKVHHYAYTKEASVVQVHGEGPFDIHYVNAADDPEKSAQK